MDYILQRHIRLVQHNVSSTLIHDVDIELLAALGITVGNTFAFEFLVEESSLSYTCTTISTKYTVKSSFKLNFSRY